MSTCQETKIDTKLVVKKNRFLTTSYSLYLYSFLWVMFKLSRRLAVWSILNDTNAFLNETIIIICVKLYNMLKKTLLSIFLELMTLNNILFLIGLSWLCWHGLWSARVVITLWLKSISILINNQKLFELWSLIFKIF